MKPQSAWKRPCWGFLIDVHMDSAVSKCNTWGSESSSDRCQKWGLRICFVSPNMYSVVETLNIIGPSCTGRGTANWHARAPPVSCVSTCMAKTGHPKSHGALLCGFSTHLGQFGVQRDWRRRPQKKEAMYDLRGGEGAVEGRGACVTTRLAFGETGFLKWSAGEQERDTLCKTKATSRTENRAPSTLKLQCSCQIRLNCSDLLRLHNEHYTQSPLIFPSFMPLKNMSATCIGKLLSIVMPMKRAEIKVFTQKPFYNYLLVSPL